MKKILVIVLALALLFSITACKEETVSTDVTKAPETEVVAEEGGLEAAAMSYFADYPGSRIVPWSDVLALLDAGEEPFILSIRQQDVYDEGHVEGAYLAAWGTDLAEKVAMLPTDQKVYVYCYTGQTAGQTVALLNLMGIDAVSIKSGYVNGFLKEENYEDYVSTEAVELPDAGAEFDKEVLAFVQEYFNAIPDGGSNILAADQVEALVESGDATVVDIRSADDYAAGHIEDAVSLPFGENMQEGFADLPEGQLVVACYSGQTAGQTVGVLRALGYDAVSLKSGMGGWSSYVTTAAANGYFADYPGSRIVPWTDVAAMIDAGEEPFILSIRQQDVYDEGHVAGAYLAAWGTDLAEKVAMLPTDETVYVYCYTGQTAGQTVALLNMLGVEAVSIKSGFNNGISTTEGYEAYISTEASELADAGAEFDPFVLSAVKAYFNSVGDNGNFIMAAADVQAAVEASEVSVVDIRSADDYAAGHIEGAVNLAFGPNMQEGFAELPSGKLVVTCYSGQTAGQTIAVLRMLGYDAYSLKSGMGGWTTAELPVVTE